MAKDSAAYNTERMPFDRTIRPSPLEAVQRLVEGNWRFRAGRLTANPADLHLRQISAQAQSPFAAMLGCSDSRMLMESIFDCGLGDLFVCRVAGNVLDAAVVGSLEYAVDVLNVPLIMVVGHERCGAVQAALEHMQAPGAIGKLVSAILPAAQEAEGQPGDHWHNAVIENVKLVVKQLRSGDSILAARAGSGELLIDGAYYSLSTGEVQLLHV
jgi:carbonic anhydrase